jgi:hypothetical protein
MLVNIPYLEHRGLTFGGKIWKTYGTINKAKTCETSYKFSKSSKMLLETATKARFFLGFNEFNQWI